MTVEHETKTERAVRILEENRPMWMAPGRPKGDAGGVTSGKIAEMAGVSVATVETAKAIIREKERRWMDSVVMTAVIGHLKSRDGDRCYMCNEAPISDPIVTHIVHPRDGGQDEMCNLQLTCAEC